MRMGGPGVYMAQVQVLAPKLSRNVKTHYGALEKLKRRKNNRPKK